jgi:hypothetical protein
MGGCDNVSRTAYIPWTGVLSLLFQLDYSSRFHSEAIPKHFFMIFANYCKLVFVFEVTEGELIPLSRLWLVGVHFGYGLYLKSHSKYC